MVPLGEQKQEEVAQTYKTSCRYVTYSRFGKLCLIVIVIVLTGTGNLIELARFLS